MKDLLIVEDDPTLGEGIRLALQAPELRPQLCRSLADAGELLSRRSFDLLILDINLPDGNGLDLLRALRRESEVPVILLTANDLETDIVAGLELGADDYITKPFSLAVLRARVNTQLRRTAAPRRSGTASPSISAGWSSPGTAFRWSSARQNRSCCGCWWSTGAKPLPGPPWWTGSGRTGRSMWTKTPSPSQ